jgi:hypothetical protein
MSNLKFTAEQRYRYIEQLKGHGNKSRAAAACGIGTETVRRARKEDPAFNEECDEALETFYDNLEEEAVRRGRDGVPEPVFYKGVECGEIQRYSDTLLLAILKGRRRHVFGDKSQVEMTGKDGGPIEMSSTERAKLVEKLLAKAAERKALLE